MRLFNGLPPHWAVLTWNADHLLAADLVRRKEKIRYLLAQAAQSKACAILVQQTGAIYPESVEEYFGELGWTVYHSGTPTGVGGVLILLLTKIALRYGIIAQVICPGASIAFTSTRICRFSLINVFFALRPTAPYTTIRGVASMAH